MTAQKLLRRLLIALLTSITLLYCEVADAPVLSQEEPPPRESAAGTWVHFPGTTQWSTTSNRAELHAVVPSFAPFLARTRSLLMRTQALVASKRFISFAADSERSFALVCTVSLAPRSSGSKPSFTMWTCKCRVIPRM
ncbi:hypothetical protein D9M68_513400 [compost metagenome]